jgi:hypothetical protein
MAEGNPGKPRNTPQALILSGVLRFGFPGSSRRGDRGAPLAPCGCFQGRALRYATGQPKRSLRNLLNQGLMGDRDGLVPCRMCAKRGTVANIFPGAILLLPISADCGGVFLEPFIDSKQHGGFVPRLSHFLLGPASPPSGFRASCFRPVTPFSRNGFVFDHFY